MSRSSPERALRQRAGGGTSPLRPPLLLAAEDRGAHGRPRMLHRRQLHRVVAPRGGRSLRHLLGLVLVEGHLAAAEKALFRGEMGQFWPTRRWASWVAPARESTRHTGPRCWTGGERRLTLRCRSPTIRGLCLEAAAQRRPISPRLIDRPAERRHPRCLGAETPAGSCRRSVRVHQPWLSAPRVSLAANLVAWHSTPNSTAPRSHPASPEHAAAHGSEEAAATAQCRPAHFGSLVDLLLRPLNHCADLQPPRPRPHGSAAACSRGTRKSAPSCAHNRDFKVDLIHFRSRSSGLAGS